MKKILLLLLAAVLLTGTGNGQSRPSDEEGVRKALAAFGNSWQKGDFSDMGDYMTPDCHWINIVGMHWKNLPEVQYAHQSFVKGMFKGVKPKVVDLSIRFVTADVAIAYWTVHMDAFYPPDGINRGDNKQGDTDDIATVILLKQKGVWRITSAQNNAVVKQAAASNPVLRMKK